jgi:hypothetical protein
MSTNTDKTYTLEEVKKHTSSESCWLIIGNANTGKSRMTTDDTFGTSQSVQSISRFPVETTSSISTGSCYAQVAVESTVPKTTQATNLNASVFEQARVSTR